MILQALNENLTVCKVATVGDFDWNSELYFIGKTDEELSLVCKTADAPSHTLAREDGWKGLRIQGELDFSLIGILAELSAVLAAHKIGLFAVSTYNTDYLLVKEENFAAAVCALEKAGHQVTEVP